MSITNIQTCLKTVNSQPASYFKGVLWPRTALQCCCHHLTDRYRCILLSVIQLPCYLSTLYTCSYVTECSDFAFFFSFFCFVFVFIEDLKGRLLGILKKNRVGLLANSCSVSVQIMYCAMVHLIKKIMQYFWNTFFLCVSYGHCGDDVSKPCTVYKLIIAWKKQPMLFLRVGVHVQTLPYNTGKAFNNSSKYSNFWWDGDFIVVNVTPLMMHLHRDLSFSIFARVSSHAIPHWQHLQDKENETCLNTVCIDQILCLNWSKFWSLWLANNIKFLEYSDSSHQPKIFQTLICPHCRRMRVHYLATVCVWWWCATKLPLLYK